MLVINVPIAKWINCSIFTLYSSKVNALQVGFTSIMLIKVIEQVPEDYI